MNDRKTTQVERYVWMQAALLLRLAFVEQKRALSDGDANKNSNRPELVTGPGPPGDLEPPSTVHRQHRRPARWRRQAPRRLPPDDVVQLSPCLF